MKKVKLSINSPKDGLLRQTPASDGIWGDYKFYINEEIEECDVWVVYSKGIKKYNSTEVAPENTIFISGEPEPIYHYAKNFIKKFGTILTTRNDIVHSNIIKSHPAQPWWVGRKIDENGLSNFELNYKELSESPKKTKLISVISSNKSFTKGHKERIEFVQKLKSHFGDNLDMFGRGINGFEDKWDTLRDYKYHIVLENSSLPDYWTEKLADAFLAETFPFYYGCKNLDKYFPRESYSLIDINNVENSIKIIEEGIISDFYKKNHSYLLEAKRKIMEEHNIFPLLCEICESLDLSRAKSKITIKHELSYLDPNKILLLIKRFYFNKIKK